MKKTKNKSRKPKNSKATTEQIKKLKKVAISGGSLVMLFHSPRMKYNKKTDRLEYYNLTSKQIMPISDQLLVNKDGDLRSYSEVYKVLSTIAHDKGASQFYID